MQYTPEQIETLRAKVRERPARIQSPAPGQESVWDYPRPPRVEHVDTRLRVLHAGVTVAETRHGLRVLETAGAPVYYFPPADVRREYLVRTADESLCEWKGPARYWDLMLGEARVRHVAWSYPDPFIAYLIIRDYVAFYAGKVDVCFVGDERVRPQPGGFYGGWITANVCGPFKGEPDSDNW